MDPVTAAIAVSASAAMTNLASHAVGEAHQALTAVLHERFPQVDLGPIGEFPDSVEEQAALSESLHRAGAARDAQVVRLAEALVAAVAREMPRAPVLAGFDLVRVRRELASLRRGDERGAEPTRLAGQDLRGADLSGRDLAGADLTGATLSGAGLAGARLMRAVANRARFDGADLRGADLTGARLMAADLRGARLSGSVLRRAALVGARVDPWALTATDTTGATPIRVADVEAQMNPPGRALAAAFSPDGELIAAAVGSSVIVYETATCLPIRVLEGHTDDVTCVAFSMDGRLLASGGDDHTVRLWDATSGRHAGVLEGHTRDVKSVAFGPDGRLASAGNEGPVRLWDPERLHQVRVLEANNHWVSSVAFSPDGRLLASAGQFDHTVRLWDVSAGRPLRVLTCPTLGDVPAGTAQFTNTVGRWAAAAL